MDADVQVDFSQTAPLLNESSSSSNSSFGSPRRKTSSSSPYFRSSASRRNTKRCKLCLCSGLLAAFLFGFILVYNCPFQLCGQEYFMRGGGSSSSSSSLPPSSSFPSLSSSPSFPSDTTSDNHSSDSQVQSESDSFLSPVLPSTVPVNFVTYDGIQQDNFEFHLADLDVMVFLHIQKTGGTTFGKHLVQDIDLDKPCVCRKPKHRPKSRQYLSDSSPRKNHKRVKRKLKCDCFRPGNDLGRSWLFSRYSTGWKCGLHPGWTELTACVDHYLDSQEGHLDNRRYFYVSFLREPVSRYLSEFKHVQRGATWKTSLHLCNGRPPTAEELPKCYQEEDWLGVRLPEFMSCESNLAANRQTRMLADLRLVNCYNTTGMSLEEREAIMLQSAKDNLQKLSFYGLTELQEESQYIFQDTFNLKFNVRFVQFDHNHADNAHDRLDEETLEKIRRINHLDVKLYEYARQLIVKRFEELKANDPDFEEHYEMMGEKPDRKKMLQTLDIEDQIDDDDEYK